MRTVRLTARTRVDARTAFDRLVDIGEYPGLAEDVVAVTTDADGSEWTLRFRDSVARWRLRHDVDRAALTADFAQETGDFAALAGSWRVTDRPDGCEIGFELRFDLGVPIYNRVMDPLIARVVARSAAAVITGVHPGADVLDGDAVSASPSRG
jgi:ribosome-associated toxin RatA of RatAB toxin-antitoxin module